MSWFVDKPIESLSFDDLLKQLELEPVPPQRRIRLHQGGPVEGGRGFVLHTRDWSSRDSLPVSGDLALTASPRPTGRTAWCAGTEAGSRDGLPADLPRSNTLRSTPRMALTGSSRFN